MLFWLIQWQDFLAKTNLWGFRKIYRNLLEIVSDQNVKSITGITIAENPLFEDYVPLFSATRNITFVLVKW